MRKSNWLDLLVQSHINEGAKAIAEAIADSPQMLTAIQTALDNPPVVQDPAVLGLSYAQQVSDAIKKVFI